MQQFNVISKSIVLARQYSKYTLNSIGFQGISFSLLNHVAKILEKSVCL